MAGSIGPLQLAWIGDAVWELHQRLRLGRSPGKANALHKAAVSVVRADAQADALERLTPILDPTEQDLVRRGRNSAGRGPRRADAVRPAPRLPPLGALDGEPARERLRARRLA